MYRCENWKPIWVVTHRHSGTQAVHYRVLRSRAMPAEANKCSSLVDRWGYALPALDLRDWCLDKYFVQSTVRIPLIYTTTLSQSLDVQHQSAVSTIRLMSIECDACEWTPLLQGKIPFERHAEKRYNFDFCSTCHIALKLADI